MPEDQRTFETKGIPTIYGNHASASLSHSDIRLYLSEIAPSQLLVSPTHNELVEKQSLLEPKFCLVMSPEFAKALSTALSNAIDQYVSLFGPLRPAPTQDQLKLSLAKPQP
jgi:hypothetical protein